MQKGTGTRTSESQSAVSSSQNSPRELEPVNHQAVRREANKFVCRFDTEKKATHYFHQALTIIISIFIKTKFLLTIFSFLFSPILYPNQSPLIFIYLAIFAVFVSFNEVLEHLGQ